MTPETRIAIDNAAHKGNSMGRSEAAANAAMAERAEYLKPASWVIVNKETGRSVAEFFDARTVAKINTAKYAAVPATEYLQAFNRDCRSEAAANYAMQTTAEVAKLAAQYGYKAAALIVAQRKGK